MKSLGVNTIILSSTSMVAQGLTALTFWLVARVLGPSDFGAIAAAIGIATMLLSTLDFGINAITIRELARIPDKPEVFSSTFGAKLLTSGIVGLLWTLLVALVSIRSSSWIPYIPLGAHIFMSDIANTLNVVPRSQQRMHILGLTTFCQKAATLVGTVLLLISPIDVQFAFPLGLVFGSTVSVFVAMAFVDRKMRSNPRMSFANLMRLWKSSAGFGLSSLAAQIQRVDVSIVAAVAGSTAAGIYAAPARLTNSLMVIPTALSTALFPRVSAASDAKSARSEGLRAIKISTLLTAMVTAVLFILAGPLVPVVLGEEYAASVPVLRSILIGTLIASVNAPLASMLQASGKELFVAKVVGFASIIGLGVVGLGGAASEASGAAIGFIVLQIAIIVPLLASASRDRTN